jgi:hypothetical protein
MRSIILVSDPEKIKKEVEKMAKKGEEEYISGKAKKIKSLDDLIKK